MKQSLLKSLSDKTYSFIMYFSGLLCCICIKTQWPNCCQNRKVCTFTKTKNLSSKSEIENP